MVYEALGELHSLIKAKVEGKHLDKGEIKPLLKTIAETGFLPYTEESLNSAIDFLFNDINNYGKEWLEFYAKLENVDEIINKARIKHGLHFTAEQMVKRIIARTVGESEHGKEFEMKAFEIIDKVKDEMKRRSAEGLGSAAVYTASKRGLTERTIYRYSFCTEHTIRDICQEIGRRHPEYSLDEVKWREKRDS